MSQNPPSHRTIRVVELRRYTTHPQRRDALIELFDREFIEPQEAAGIAVLGQFRDLDHADTFTWLRGFTNMRSRADALTAFYGGPVWTRCRDEANATMIDSDDVLLLEPTHLRPLAPTSARTLDDPLVEITIAHLATPVTDRDTARAADAMASSCRVDMVLRTLHAINDFPRLPVREDTETLVVVSTRFGPDDARQPATAEVLDDLLGNAIRSVDTFRLRPTAGARWR
jgi:hypothetical protein